MPDAPKPTVGFIVVQSGWDPRNGHDRLSTWNSYPSRKEAEAERAARANVASGPEAIMRFDITYTIVDDGGFGEA